MADVWSKEEARYKKQVEPLVKEAGLNTDEKSLEAEKKQIVSEELEAEKMNEWRENFLEENPTVFRGDFVQRTARVMEHERALECVAEIQKCSGDLSGEAAMNRSRSRRVMMLVWSPHR